jgi:hypothetical protein
VRPRGGGGSSWDFGVLAWWWWWWLPRPSFFLYGALAMVVTPLLILGAILGRLHLPRILGYVVSQCVTVFALRGHKLHFGEIHILPWVRFSFSFSFKNPNLSLTL